MSLTSVFLLLLTSHFIVELWRYYQRREIVEAPKDDDHKLLNSMAGRLGNRYNNLFSAIVGHLSMLEDNCTEQQKRSIGAIEKAVQRATRLNKSLMVYASERKGDEVCDINIHLRVIEPVLALMFGDVCKVKFKSAGHSVIADLSRKSVQSLIQSTIAAICNTSKVDELTYMVGLIRGVPSVDFIFAGVSEEQYKACQANGEIVRYLSLEKITVEKLEKGIRISFPCEKYEGQRELLDTLKLKNVNGQAEGAAVVPNENTILIIDDDKPLVQLCKTIMEKAGYWTEIAYCGEDGLKIFRENMSQISAVILDLAMPGMNGQTVFLHMKKLCPDIPVILCTGYDLNSVEHLKDIGFAGFLQKPVPKKTMLGEIERVLGSKTVVQPLTSSSSAVQAAA